MESISPRKPLLTIQPRSRWAALDLREVWLFRDLLLTLAGRDLKVRYKQTVLGVMWVILQPLIAAGIFAFVFGGVANLEAPGAVPYFLFSFVGLLAWGVFSSTLNRTSGVMVGNEHLVSKVYFPRLILPLTNIFATLIDFMVALGMLVILLAVFWHFPAANLLLMPVCVLLLLMLALGVGFAATALNVSYRDVGYITPVAVQFLLYASPVAYSVQEVPEAYRTVYMLNPLAPLLEAFRWSILGVGQVHWGFVTYAAAVCIGTFVVGAFVFKSMERKFADVI
jgi:lipopolysaccharide transport system permease protein